MEAFLVYEVQQMSSFGSMEMWAGRPPCAFGVEETPCSPRVLGSRGGAAGDYIRVHKELGHVPVSSTIRYEMGKCYWNSRIMLRCLPFLVLNQHCCIWNLFAALLWG